jgi:hypothetical protein
MSECRVWNEIPKVQERIHEKIGKWIVCFSLEIIIIIIIIINIIIIIILLMQGIYNYLTEINPISRERNFKLT